MNACVEDPHRIMAHASRDAAVSAVAHETGFAKAAFMVNRASN